MARPVAARYKIQRFGRRGLHRSQQSRFTRHGNRRGRQAAPGVGVVGCVCQQVAFPQVAVKAVTQAVNHGGIGLQPHIDAQAIGEHACNLRPVCGSAGFFFNNAGQYQGFVA